MKRLIEVAVVGLAFFGGIAATTVFDRWEVEKIRCTKMVVFWREDGMGFKQTDFYWDWLDASGAIIKENWKSECGGVTLTNRVKFADYVDYAKGAQKDHYKAIKLAKSGVDE